MLSDPILCFYINKTPQTQVARFATLGGRVCDRIIRPDEHLLFDAYPGSILEIHLLTSEHTRLITSFQCQDLKVSNDLIETMLRWLA